MEDFGFVEMQEIQRKLQEKYKNIWEPVNPQTGKNKLLWLMIELGEVAVMLCYDISVEELKKIYLDKHKQNLERW